MPVSTHLKAIILGLSMTFASPIASNAQTMEELAAVKIAPNTETFKLDNDLTVVVIPDHRAPVVTHMIWYKVGAADEPMGKSGIAHFLEHLMFKGTPNYPDGEFSNIVSDIGGQENAFTSWDYTAYFQRVSKEHLGLLMELEADRMTNLILSDEVVNPERKVVLEERSQRTDNDPSAKLGEAISATLYQNHPYGIPIIGWKHEIEDLTKEDAIHFYRQFYTPNNAVLVVAGDVTVDEVRELAEKTYGKVEKQLELGPRKRPTEPTPVTERRVTIRDERVTQPSLQISFLTPSYHTSEASEAPALDLLSEILSSGSISRLYQSLVANNGPAAFAGSYYRSDGLDKTQFVVYGVPREEIDLDTIEQALLAELEKIKSDGVTDEELNRAKKKLIAQTIYAQDSQTTLARIFGAALTTGETVEDVQNWPAKITAVTSDDIKAVAEKYLNPDIAVYGIQLPKKQDEKDPS
jgi:zinc protease